MEFKTLIQQSINRAGIFVASVILFSTAAFAQKVPTDLLDLSIEELFNANVITDSERAISDNRWHVSYAYAISDYDEYYIGSSSVSYDDVLFSPGLEPRTQNNYPVVPTEIKQEVHALRVAYDLTDAMTVRAQLPMVKQSTDHISIVPGYDAFNISSDGVGDLVSGAGSDDVKV
jgi:hypothetical protein